MIGSPSLTEREMLDLLREAVIALQAVADAYEGAVFDPDVMGSAAWKAGSLAWEINHSLPWTERVIDDG